MKFLDLFAGVGGIRLGMEQAGHECVGWVEWDKFARKSYQAIHDTTNEWTATDINEVNATDIPRANVWCFGFPCQDISLAGKQGGFTNGKRSSLFFTVTGLIRQLKEEDKPSYLLIENVKNLLSINGGWDFLKLQIELDEIGYDAEWDVLDSAEVVPQHRERIYIIGHLRGRSTREVFPIRREDGEVNKANVINPLKGKSDYGWHFEQEVHDENGLCRTLKANGGSGNIPKVILQNPAKVKVIGNTSNTGYRSHDVLDSTGISTTLMSRDYKDPKQVAVKQIGNLYDTKSFGGNPQRGRVYDASGISPTLNTMQGGGLEPKILDDQGRKNKKITPTDISPTLRAQAHGNEPKIVIPTLTPDRINKRQNGRRFKEDGDPEFTLTAQDRHGIYDGLRIRKLTPRECWRLQGFPDWAFDKAQEVNSNSQLYKQAGNSVTVPVIKAIAERLSEDKNDNTTK